LIKFSPRSAKNVTLDNHERVDHGTARTNVKLERSTRRRWRSIVSVLLQMLNSNVDPFFHWYSILQIGNVCSRSIAGAFWNSGVSLFRVGLCADVRALQILGKAFSHVR